MTQRVILLGLAGFGLAFVGLVAMVVLNWDTVSVDLDQALARQGEKAQATLFRLGETMSIGARLRERFGADADVRYDTDTGTRVLGISMGDSSHSDQRTSEKRAREIASFAIRQTTKSEQIDVVEVRFRDSPESFRFTPKDLMSDQPQVESVEPDRPAAESSDDSPG